MMINFEKVSKEYVLESGNFTVLKPTDLHVRKGEFVAIMGPSGSGKVSGRTQENTPPMPRQAAEEALNMSHEHGKRRIFMTHIEC